MIFLRSQNIHFDGLRLDDVAYIDHEIDEMMSNTRVFENDVLLNITGASLGRVTLVPDGFPPANVNQHVSILRPIAEQILPAYLNYSVASASVQAQIFCDEQGTSREAVTFTQIKNFQLSLPPLPEQHAIADFLDRETARLDALIGAKARLIELLKEKRAALISHVVTKGLDPNVPMKDSRIEWLGEVPAHWIVMRLAMAAQKITNGFVGPTRDIYVKDSEEAIRYLQSLHIKNGEIIFNEHEKQYYVSSEWSLKHSKSILREGDVLIVQTGGIGECATVTKEFEGANCHALIIVQLKDGYGSGYYLSALLRSDYGRNALLASMTGALHPHLECGKVREIAVVLPPAEEQDRIVASLDVAITQYDSLAEKVEVVISKLQEYRTALIAATVTGKIDVREEA